MVFFSVLSSILSISIISSNISPFQISNARPFRASAGHQQELQSLKPNSKDEQSRDICIICLEQTSQTDTPAQKRQCEACSHSPELGVVQCTNASCRQKYHNPCLTRWWEQSRTYPTGNENRVSCTLENVLSLKNVEEDVRDVQNQDNQDLEAGHTTRESITRPRRTAEEQLTYDRILYAERAGFCECKKYVREIPMVLWFMVVIANGMIGKFILTVWLALYSVLFKGHEECDENPIPEDFQFRCKFHRLIATCIIASFMLVLDVGLLRLAWSDFNRKVLAVQMRNDALADAEMLSNGTDRLEDSSDEDSSVDSSDENSRDYARP